ncbi:hypothetical protein CSE16_06080 [Solibacillus sp. R5-41]|uniref:hypothetical protein n=1 Tax=Solibacillus sp. R5-41 TaxID=2048654 RepID=UPI000C124EE6|nr:hypothetical protein [Solibacillus sp. R5-41]ATP39653.1 hypothetical protein CSE16_06080 [Solibacillus sp. R5-41]
MSEINNQQIDGLMRGMIGDFMKEQIKHVKKSNDEENNSFVFFEKSTLNVLLEHLLTGEKRSSNNIVSDEFEETVLAKLDEVIENNQKEFEDIINKLKKLS